MRKLVTIREIAEIKPIPDADKICAYRVDGWWVVDSINKYNVGDYVMYIEPDAWVPNTLAPFLSKGKEPKEYKGIQGERLRTIKLKKQLSQGLLLSIPDVITADYWDTPKDYSDDFGVVLWEPVVDLKLRSDLAGVFPSAIPKTDAERIQNLAKDFEQLKEITWEQTEKVHGSSCTFYLDDDDAKFRVCSRNFEVKHDGSNAYSKAATKYLIEEKMRQLNLYGTAIQGEVLGPGINGNQYGFYDVEFLVFSVFDKQYGYWHSESRLKLCSNLGLKHVPVINSNYKIECSLEDLLLSADCVSNLNNSKREGFVLKSAAYDGCIKVISNDWLLNEK